MVVHKLEEWSKQYCLPGFSNVPVYNVLSFIIKESRRDAITTRANSVAFNFFIAIFPGVIFVFTLIPLLPFGDDIMDYYVTVIDGTIRNALPAKASDYFLNIIHGVTQQVRGGLLSLGFLLSAFFASNGMLTLMFGFDKSYDKVFKKRGYFRQRAVAIALTTLLIILLLFSVLFIVVGDEILKWILNITHLEGGNFLFSGLRILLAISVIYIGVTIIYRYGPSMYRRIKFWSPGAILATILSILTSLGFSFFINNFGRYNEIYGSIGALIVIMIWFKLNAFVLLVGFELNASIAVNRDLLADWDD